jgi:RNA polymerase sigma-70 factor, ECF subfamily
MTGGHTLTSSDDAVVERLVRSAKTGDVEAFACLFDRYHRPVHRYIASRIGRSSDAEDLTQLVFVRALQALPFYEFRGVPFSGWLFRLARNALIDHVRSHRDHAQLDALAEQIAGPDRPDEMAITRQDLDDVAIALATLTDEQREAISLRFFGGLSAREAAEAMGCQEGTVRGLQFRGLAALRRQLQVQDERERPARMSRG